jgi:hypothetical protein
MNLRLGLCALTVVAFTSCKSKPTLDGPCDPKEMEGLRSASKNVNPEDRATITTAGLAEACELKLPSGVAEGMKALGSVSPADRATIIAGVLAENMSFTRLACPEWEKLAPQIASLEPAKKSDFLYSGCKYERFDLLTKAEFEQSWKVSGYVLIAVPMYAWLVEKNMEPAEAKRLARDMFVGEVAEPPAEAPPADAPVPAQ